MSDARTHWGQVICGPPGSGKSTYAAAMAAFCNAAHRRTVIVNLDPANDRLPYTAAVNILDLVPHAEVVEAYDLGPNGALMYCLEYLDVNFDWLEEKLGEHEGAYFLFDCPGQAELYTHHAAFANIVKKLQALDYRVCAVHLVDSHHCTDASKFISAALLSLTAMIRLELPHVNVLSKLDMIQTYGSLPFDLEYYTQAEDLSALTGLLQDDSPAGHLRRRGMDVSRMSAGLRALDPLRASAMEAAEEELEAAPDVAKQVAEADAPAGVADGTSRRADDAARNSAAPSAGSVHADGGARARVASTAAAAGHADAASAAAAAHASVELLARSKKRRRRFMDRYKRLNARLAEVVEEYHLLSFVPFCVNEPDAMLRLIKLVDKAVGFVPLAAPSSSAASGAMGAFTSRSTPAAGGAQQQQQQQQEDVIASTQLSEWEYDRLSAFEGKYAARRPRDEGDDAAEDEEDAEEDTFGQRTAHGVGVDGEEEEEEEEDVLVGGGGDGEEEE